MIWNYMIRQKKETYFGEIHTCCNYFQNFESMIVLNITEKQNSFIGFWTSCVDFGNTKSINLTIKKLRFSKRQL